MSRKMKQNFPGLILLLIQFVNSVNILKKVSFATFTDTLKIHQEMGYYGDVISLDCPDKYEVMNIIEINKL